MKMTYIIVGLILIGGIVFYLASCGAKNKDENKVTNTPDSSNVETKNVSENPYEGLRKMAFTVTPDQLGLNLSQKTTSVYGVIMDWEMNGAIATTVSYQTGDASLYLSSGGGVIGGGQHENVNPAAKEFVKLSQSYLEKSSKTESTALPGTDTVKFYFLTNKGIYTGQESMKNFENNSSTWLGLFEEGNKVLTELRQVSERK